MKNGSEPPPRDRGTGFLNASLTDVRIAVATPTSRSSKSGNDTALMVSIRSASSKPIPLPKMIGF
jgi:hypothetical protein